MLASFTTNPVPGGSANDTLTVDSVVLIYNSELATLTYDGKDIFVKGQTVFNVDSTYISYKLKCTSNGRGATIEKSYDKTTGILTLTVKGNDWSEDNLNQHVYYVKFAQEKLYQLPNADFETWATDKEPGLGWNSFVSAGGQWASFASASPAPEKVEGYESNTAVRLTSKNLFIANANGNLTTGRINMGDMTPKDAANYNFTDLEDPAHCLLFADTATATPRLPTRKGMRRTRWHSQPRSFPNVRNGHDSPHRSNTRAWRSPKSNTCWPPSPPTPCREGLPTTRSSWTMWC